jgi:hypothetical protein
MRQPVLPSIQVGRPAEHGTGSTAGPVERPWTSGFFKSSVDGAVFLGRTNLEGDGLVDLVNHGGPTPVAPVAGGPGGDCEPLKLDGPATSDLQPPSPFNDISKSARGVGRPESSGPRLLEIGLCRRTRGRISCGASARGAARRGAAWKPPRRPTVEFPRLGGRLSARVPGRPGVHCSNVRQDLRCRAGEGIRTPDVQLGKLAFYH